MHRRLRPEPAVLLLGLPFRVVCGFQLQLRVAEAFRSPAYPEHFLSEDGVDVESWCELCVLSDVDACGEKSHCVSA